MHLKRLLVPMMIAAIFLTGCSELKPGLEEYSMPTQAETKVVDKEAKSAVERMAEKKHVKAELSDDFVSRYMDISTFDELKRRTEEGIRITQNTADMTESEFKLWEDIISSEQMDQYTVSDMEVKKEELNSIIKKMADEKQTSISGLAEKYGMTEDEMDQFLNKQAEKYVEKDIEQ